MTCRPEMTDEGAVCQDHGSAWTSEGCLTLNVLDGVAKHREWQFSNYGGNRDIKDGTGKDVAWLVPVEDYAHDHDHDEDTPASRILELFREEWDYDNSATDEEKAEFTKQASWMRMVREEIAEAFIETDPDRLEEELTQVAALCASWIEKLHERKMWQYGHLRDDGSVYSLVDWYSPADVYRDQHGLAEKGSVVKVARRRPGGEWEDMPS